MAKKKLAASSGTSPWIYQGGFDDALDPGGGMDEDGGRNDGAGLDNGRGRGGGGGGAQHQPLLPLAGGLGPWPRGAHRTPLNLFVCISGVLGSLCVYGVLQERVMTIPYGGGGGDLP
jgi:hypothetical protein